MRGLTSPRTSPPSGRVAGKCYWQVSMAMSRNALLRAARNSPARFIQVAAALIPQHFKFEHEHSIAGLSTEELRERLNEARARLLEAGVVIDAESLPPALPAAVSESENGLLRGQAKPRTEVRASPARRNRKTASIN